jgi:hypothetical protein
LDNLNQNLGCPIKPAKRTCPPRLQGGPYGPAQDPQKLWGKWCKILHSGHILAHKSQFQIGFFYWNFCLTSHKAPRSSGLKGAKICNLVISAVFYGAGTPFGNLFYISLPEALSPGHKLPHVWETEIDQIRVITRNGIGIRFWSNINNAKVPMIFYLKSFIFIAILRGNLGNSTHKTWKE